jgi:hypothetical protein
VDASLAPGYEHLYLVDLDDNTVRLPDGEDRARSHCRFAPLIHFMPDPLI